MEGKCPILPQIGLTEKIVEGERQHVTTSKNKVGEIGESSGGLSGNRRNEYLVGENIESVVKEVEVINNVEEGIGNNEGPHTWGNRAC